MGLAERKDKQRIGRDPRNLAWARDTTSFGQRMLMRQGWTPGAGLGASGTGCPDALARAVPPASSRLGLGADPKISAEDSYQQMAAFQSVLARLNAASQGGDAQMASHEAPEGATVACASDSSSENDSESASESTAASNALCSSSDESASESDSDAADTLSASSECSETNVATKEPAKRRRIADKEAITAPVRPVSRLAHRQKFIRNKAVSSYSAEQLREIFG